MIRRYQSEDGVGRTLSDHYAAMLDSIPWQLFMTIRGDRGGQDRLKQVIDHFRRNCERSFHAPLTMVYSCEARPFWNAHAAVASSANLLNWNYSYCHRILKNILGNDPDRYDLQPYRPDDYGLRYILKTIDNRQDDGSSWDLVNCDLYLQSERNTRRARRQRERLADRGSKAS